MGRSLAEAAYPHTLHLGVGSLGHSPDSRLEGPRLMVDSAQCAEYHVDGWFDGLYVQMYVFVPDLVALKVAGFLYYSV